MLSGRIAVAETGSHFLLPYYQCRVNRPGPVWGVKNNAPRLGRRIANLCPYLFRDLLRKQESSNKDRTLEAGFLLSQELTGK